MCNYKSREKQAAAFNPAMSDRIAEIVVNFRSDCYQLIWIVEIWLADWRECSSSDSASVCSKSENDDTLAHSLQQISLSLSVR